MLRLLMGRARTGKSERVLNEIAAAGRLTPMRRQILLVPEHASHVAEVDLCRACGDTASRYAEVLTFKLLASRVLSLTGGSADVTLDAGGKLLTLRLALQELSGALKVYCRPSQRSAFLESLLDVMEELIAYAVEPETLMERVADVPGEVGDKLRDIALLYGVYLGKLHAEGRDARDRLEKLEENLEASGYIDGKDVYLDGFSYFTGRELRILRILLRRANSVTITLLGDMTDRELFRESLRVREQLVREAADAGIPCDTAMMVSRTPQTALDYVERNFFGTRETWEGETDSIRVFECADAYAEAERAAAEILRLVREEGWRFRDITVAARELSAYEAVVETVFARYGVPLYRARRSDILQQSVTTLVLGALDAVTGGFEYDDMFRFLKTGLAGVTAEECDVLENYVLRWDIRGKMWVNDAPWTAHPDGYGAAWDEDAHARLDAVNEARERLRIPLSRLYGSVHGSGRADDKVKALYRYLEEIDLPETLRAQTEQLFAAGETQRAEELSQLWTILCGVLDQFVSILGETELDAEEFPRLLRLVLTQYGVGTIPAALDQVNFSELTRNDRHTVRALFLLGANDGVLPATEGRGGVLREEERLALEERDIRLAPHGMAWFRLEIQNLYAALAQPTERLYVSYDLFDGAGAEQRPSFVVGRLQALCPAAETERDDPAHAYRLASAAGALEYASEHIDGAAWRLLETIDGMRPRLDAMRRASQLTRGRLSGEAVRALYGESVTLSASRMDRARACHFAYFMQYGLRAKERGSAGFDAPQRGTFLHDVMEHTLRAAEREGGIQTLSKEALHRLTREAVENYIARELPDLAEKTARFRYLFRRLCESMYRIMDEVADELRSSDFVPLAFELRFGADGDLPAVTIREEGRTVRVVGAADRVDGWLTDGKLYLRVVDYKTGKKSMDLAELRYGLGVQMLLYLFTLAREGRDFFGAEEIVPAGVLYTPARDELLAAPRNIDDAALAKKAKAALRRSGMVLNDPAVLRAMEHEALSEPLRLPVSVKTDKDGQVRLGGSLATAEQLGKLSRYVDKLLRDIARETEQGNIDADPFARTPQDVSCAWCPYVRACHFEPGRGTDRIEYLQKTDADAFWGFIDETVDGKGAATDG